MHTRPLGPFSVSAIGLGCMNLSHAYGTPPSAEQGERVLLAALDAGVTLFDTAALYGFGANETLVGRVLKPHRSRFTLASKGGMAGVAGGDGTVRRVIDGRPEAIRRTCEDSLRRLQTDVIDLYYLHRWDKKVPIEDSVGAMSRLVEQGKVRTHRPVRSVGADPAQGACGAPDRRAADRVLAVDAQPGDRRAGGLPGAGRRLRRLQPGGPRLPVRRPCTTSTTLDAKDIRRAMPRFAPEHCAREPEAAAGLQGAAHARRAARRPSWRWPGCCTRAATSSRSRARPASSTCARISAQRT